MNGTGRTLALRWILCLTALFLAAVLMSPARVDAQVPRLMSFQGFLASSGGVPVNATLSMTFKLYDGPTGGAAQVWSETQTVPVANGVYSVILGSLTALPADFSVAYWLGITVGTDAEMTPRQALVSAPYALHAAKAGCTPGDQSTCYTGQAGTLNVGPCTSGIRTCDSQGNPGNCVGEVVPASEVCGNGIDDNCNTTVDEGCTFPNGTACTTNSQCSSGFCVDGVCCNTVCSSLCVACSSAKTGGSNGTCANIPAATDPDNECAGATTCSGSGTCSSLPNGTVCTSNAECQSSFCRDGVCCNTNCGGTCQACTTAKKGSGADGTCGTIGAGLDPDNECAGATSCSGSGTCSSLPTGTACSSNAECQSSFCVDGFCCGTSCSGTCVACSAAKNGNANGTCTNIPAGTDPDAECALACNGAGACQ